MIRSTRLIVFLFTAALACAVVNTYGQRWPSDLWYDGQAVLESGDTLVGKIKYDMKQDLIQFNVPNTRIDAFSARKLLYFEIFDQSIRRYRQFFVLPYANESQYKTPVFFELLTEGKLTLLTRESIELRTYSSPYYMGSYSREVLVNRYYFLDSDGNIQEFRGSKAELLDMMGKKSDDVEKYIRSNRLKIDEKYDFARIIAYYNSI